MLKFGQTTDPKLWVYYANFELFFQKKVVFMTKSKNKRPVMTVKQEDFFNFIVGHVPPPLAGLEKILNTVDQVTGGKN